MLEAGFYNTNFYSDKNNARGRRAQPIGAREATFGGGKNAGGRRAQPIGAREAICAEKTPEAAAHIPSELGKTKIQNIQKNTIW